ncbi:D-alanyl-D-alanine carboxypeptidase/D-alanyl-D-alanine-endopeptidase [Galbibacter pacificus]|uniref:D-alanyl-D-alanine carboxypeptidase n=1 Tax=Galbibacter pacificus TaxID=2996052 RepID=A0ABT6FRH6_9FLAO|nr:D-alanyl-D-alanine carboxypeptidase [Galbibacter pacificus]MDG3581655.1 D-alanyl-D-alanine carboxypeptidase [Galbibacter pacificus]MDG3585871.1 D-alanyl-D-alanine carboxypeptidase [Galbibacter pacificus]
MKKNLLLFLSIVTIGCASHKKLVKTTTDKLETDFFKNQFTGFFVYNPKSGDTIFNYNGEKYFTPASNTKIFTLYTAHTLLPENLPVLKYIVKNGQLYIEGLGNPTTLHPYVKDSSLVKFLKNQNNIKLYYNNITDHRYGPGWSWDDFDAYYAPERNPLPLYGNVVTLAQTDSLYASPLLFKDSVTLAKTKYQRAMKNNHFYIDPEEKDTIEIPFITDNLTTKHILENIVEKPIAITNEFPKGGKTTLYGIKADTVYKRMMHISDNFIAEQLLILSSSMLSDTLSSNKARDYILDNELSGIPQNPRWVDGSGLSRYNLFTPQSMVFVLNKLYKEIPTDILFDIFPTGGETGTIKNYFKGNPTPYIHAKTGTLSNNYCLSGYLKTKSGETLIFSFMNNHYRGGSTDVKKHMTPLLEWIRDNY